MIFPWYPKALGPWQMAALCAPALLLFRRDLCGMFLVDIAPATPGLPVDGGLPRSKNAVLRNDINRLWINYERNKYSNTKHRGLTTEKEDLTKMPEFWATDNWSGVSGAENILQVCWCGSGSNMEHRPQSSGLFLCGIKRSQFGSQSFWPSSTCLPGNDQSQFLRWSFGQAHGASHPRVFSRVFLVLRDRQAIPNVIMGGSGESCLSHFSCTSNASRGGSWVGHPQRLHRLGAVLGHLTGGCGIQLELVLPTGQKNIQKNVKTHLVKLVQPWWLLRNTQPAPAFSKKPLNNLQWHVVVLGVGPPMCNVNRLSTYLYSYSHIQIYICAFLIYIFN